MEVSGNRIVSSSCAGEQASWAVTVQTGRSYAEHVMAVSNSPGLPAVKVHCQLEVAHCPCKMHPTRNQVDTVSHVQYLADLARCNFSKHGMCRFHWFQDADMTDSMLNTDNLLIYTALSLTDQSQCNA